MGLIGLLALFLLMNIGCAGLLIALVRAVRSKNGILLWLYGLFLTFLVIPAVFLDRFVIGLLAGHGRW